MKNDIFANVSRDTLIQSLVTDFFDEVLLIDVKTEKVLNVLEIVFNREKAVRRYDGKPYDEQIVKTLQDALAEPERTRIKDLLLLENIIKKLSSRSCYTVSLAVNSRLRESIEYKELEFKYLDRDRDIIVLQCRDVSGLVFNETDGSDRELLRELKGAIADGQFEVWFQPQVDFSERRLLGAEALVRWRHPQKGMISPNKFISLFENFHCIGILDKYVFRKVCSYISKWSENGWIDESIPVSVNLSRNDIFYNGFYEELLDILKEHGISPGSVNIEITESAYLQNSEQLMAVVDKLRSAGLQIAMDDFGSGYSSLNSLKDISIDRLKLDMKFLSSSVNPERSKTILSSIIAMAKKLDLSVMAEGVETLEQAQMLQDFGCEHMQGYYFAKPMPADEFEKLLKTYSESK